jgi:rhamnopyranosyl-N-acetylglucosaminyl-diphospho-decaprenol beta-1,3/1,4-galactofuranosyltransferase
MQDIGIFVVVVTYNRLDLLKLCLNNLLLQSRLINRIVVVDNNSSDGTQEWLKAWQSTNSSISHVILNGENSGGAGGFVLGMKYAVENGADWIWMMDDDALPLPDALDSLVNADLDASHVYGSLAVKGSDTAWVTTLVDEGRTVNAVTEVPPKARVQSLPFLGFMIHRNLVEKIGYPDPGFFIAADDVEYCLRAQRAGADIYIVGRSLIEHPKSVRYKFGPLTCLSLPPWKRYYDTRNRLLIARKYYGFALIYKTIPGSFLRLLAALVREPQKMRQVWAFIAGMVDGLLGKKGRRHEAWRIRV